MHEIVLWLSDHFVPVWKAVSIALTGGFGVLGLLTEFKDKGTKKITKWGRISLTGIVLSTILGVAAQLKESAEDSAKALALAETNNKTLNEIERSLHPLDVKQVSLDFEVPCNQLAFRNFCRDVITKAGPRIGNTDSKTPVVFASEWKGYLFPSPWFFIVNVFAGRNGKAYVPGDTFDDGDLSFMLSGTDRHEDESFSAFGTASTGIVDLTMTNPGSSVRANNGILKSVLDLHGATVVLPPRPEFTILGLTGVIIESNSGESISSFEPEKRTTSYGSPYYIFHFK